MKLRVVPILFWLLQVPFLPLAQDIAPLAKELSTVETAKFTHRQVLKDFGEGLFNYSLISVDSKGRETETQYNFSFSDIDINTVRALTKKDLILVQLLVSGKQNLIQVVKDGGNKISFTNEFNFLAFDSKNSHQLVTLIKEIIPISNDLEENRLALNGYEDHINWLLDNISDIELPKKQIIQRTTSEKGTPGKFVLDQTFNAKNTTQNERFELNLSVINPNSIAYRISGDEFTITAATRRSINGIRYFQDGQQKNYQKNIKIYAKSITNGKAIFKVLKSTISLAEEAFSKSRPSISTNKAALSYLNQTFATIKTAEETLTQNLTIQENVAKFKLTETTPNESTTNVYGFNFADINANNIDFDGQKDRLFVFLPTKKSVNFIQRSENGELQNYGDTVKFYFGTIEEAIIGTEALKVLAKNYEKKMDGLAYSSNSSSAAIEQIKKVLKKVKIEEDSYDSFIELTEAKTHMVKITTVFSNLKKSVETVQEFSLNDINAKNCKILVKGKHVLAELNTKHLEKIVKTYIDGEIKPYQYKVQIEAAGVEEARQIIGIIKNILEKLD